MHYAKKCEKNFYAWTKKSFFRQTNSGGGELKKKLLIPAMFVFRAAGMQASKQ